jgi:hypothetical protein
MLSLGPDIRGWTEGAGNSGRGLPRAPAAPCEHRKSAVAEAILQLESLALGRVREGEQRRLPTAVAACRVAREVGNSPDTRMRPARATATAVSLDRGDIETIRDIRFCSAGVRSGFCGGGP